MGQATEHRTPPAVGMGAGASSSVRTGTTVRAGSEAMKNDQEQTPQPLLLTIPQAAQCLGLSRAKLYALLAQEGGPPVVRFGRSVRISVASLQSWLQQYEEQQREH